jgi:uncharacterized protein (TIGR02145 family)
MNSTLSWTCTDPESDPLTFDVYFGTDNLPTQVATGQSETTYDPGTLQYSTQYFWKIVAHDDQGNSTEGAVWSFTTEEEEPAGFSCGDALIDSRDDQQYATVQIGDRCWMTENLNIGTMINVSSEQTNNSEIEKYCYGNSEANCDVYGGLYQWNEMMQYQTTEGVQGICPTGWHVSTDDEWTVLITYLGGESVAGGKIKETGTSHWNSPNTGATNSSGFTGLPGGTRLTNGVLDNLGNYGYFWSSTENSTTNAWLRYLFYSDGSAGSYNDQKGYGFSVRCVGDL